MLSNFTCYTSPTAPALNVCIPPWLDLNFWKSPCTWFSAISIHLCCWSSNPVIALNRQKSCFVWRDGCKYFSTRHSAFCVNQNRSSDRDTRAGSPMVGIIFSVYSRIMLFNSNPICIDVLLKDRSACAKRSLSAVYSSTWRYRSA